jgi:hypothetical protein
MTSKKAPELVLYISNGETRIQVCKTLVNPMTEKDIDELKTRLINMLACTLSDLS